MKGSPKVEFKDLKQIEVQIISQAINIYFMLQPIICFIFDLL